MVTKKTTTKKAPAATPAKKVTPVAEKPRLSKPHEILMSSNTQNAVSMEAWGQFAGKVDLQELANDLGEQTAKVQDGDMRPIEGMLFRQAKTLETMFTNLARRAVVQDHLKQFQTHLTLALKAQAQCRATLEALAEVKNPRSVAFVKQANYAQGHQQVNNNSYASASGHSDISTPAENFQSEQSKLLGSQNVWGGGLAPKMQKNEITEGVPYYEKAA